MKPHLSKFAAVAWMCDGWGYVGYGLNPAHAYDEWFHRLPPHKAALVNPSRSRP